MKILKKKLTFKENYNLKALPDKIEKLEIKLKKSETILDNNELYYNDKITFDKTLVEITNIKKEISLAEDQLLDLQILQDEINKK
jgi:ATP-binding cassette subfamily F protein uup